MPVPAHPPVPAALALFIAILALTTLGGAYALGLRRLRRSWSRTSSAASFYLGLLVLVAALFSPLDRLALELLAAHMLQHMLLLVVAPPLLLMGRPAIVLSLAAPRSARAAMRKFERSRFLKWIASTFDQPVIVLLALTASLWVWHLPAVYEAALRNAPLHALEHATFLGSGLLLWSSVVGTRARRGRRPAKALFLLFANGLQSAALGAILTFAGSELYPLNSTGAAGFGLTGLQDQQAAGAIMWIPGGLVYTVTMAVVMWRWFNGLERPAAPRRREGLWGRT
jgi:putative membrane protein